MAFGDYLNGPAYKKQVLELEGKLSELQDRYIQANAVASQLPELQERYSKMQALAKKYGAMDVLELQLQIKNENIKLDTVRQAVQGAEQELALLSSQLFELQGKILVFEETVLLESFALYEPKFKLNASREYKARLDGVRQQQKNMVRTGEAATGNMEWHVNGSKAEGRKLVNDMIKLVIRSFNNEADYCVDNVKFDNVELGEKRIRQSFDSCNRLGRVMTVRLSEQYLNLKLDELHLAHEFQMKIQEEKEEAKRVREELREQQKLEQEIRATREKIAKERKHFTSALQDLYMRLEKVVSNEDRGSFLKRIAELEQSKKNLDSEEKMIDYREQNAKAGYVYVISNIGAFGEGVYKIGMTRRLEPMERIDELGDASVPFWFDVHAMIFSDNAPALEGKLHEHFAAGRLNKFNGRKEFFRADIAEIESVIRENYDAVVEVTREAQAEQYRESLRMTMPTVAIQLSERAAAKGAQDESVA